MTPEEERLQAEKYINMVRLLVVGLLTILFLLRLGNETYPRTPGFPYHILGLGAGLAFCLFIQICLRGHYLLRALPWMALSIDTLLISLAILSDPFSQYPQFPVWNVSNTSLYAIYYVMILFSVIRHNPGFTFTAGVLSALAYALIVFLPYRPEPQSYYYINEAFKLAFLVLTGFVSAVNARKLKISFRNARTSEERRLESDSRLKSFSGSLPGAIFQMKWDRNGHLSIGYLSEGIEDLLEIGRSQLVQDPKLLSSRLSGETLRRVESRDKDSLGRTWSEEFPYMTPRGEEKWIRTTVSLQSLSRGGWALHGLMLNVTAQKKAELAAIQAREEAEEANRAKTSFMANMSHELRTPLNAILGIADLLEHSPLNEEQKANLETLRASGETLLGLIKDILDFSRLETGSLTVENVPIDLQDLIRGVHRLFVKEAQEKGLDFSCLFLTPLPNRIMGDPVRIRQILVNLVGNALKFTPRGCVSIEVADRFAANEAGREVDILVRDSGIGIHAKDLSRIFEKFTQADDSKSRRFGGTGLGLSICQGLAELIGGRLSVQSQPGTGSVFTLTLHTNPAEQSEAPLFQQKEKTMENLPAIRVLLVEDNEVNQDVQARMLQKLGAAVDVASSGQEALRIVQTRAYQIIFMDWQMPVMDGQETTARIRALPRGREIAIIGLSGHALPGDRETLLSSGFDDYLSKPVRMSDFKAMLDKWVKPL